MVLRHPECALRRLREVSQPLCEPLESRLLLSAHPTSENVPVERLLPFQPLRHASLGNVAEAASAGEIRGTLWGDLNANGLRDLGEPILAGRKVFLDANRNGLADAGESSTFTDATGAYRFTGLAPGNYVVGQVVSPGWTATSPIAQLPLMGNYIAMAQHSGELTAQVWFEDPAGPTGQVSQTYTGDLWGSTARSVTGAREGESVTAGARIDGPGTPGQWDQIRVSTMGDRNFFSGPHTGDIHAQADSQWQFRVGNQDVVLSASGQSLGGDFCVAGFELYDQTAGQSEGEFVFTSGGTQNLTLLANHVYTLWAYSISEANRYGDPSSSMAIQFQAPVIRAEERYVTVSASQGADGVDFGSSMLGDANGDGSVDVGDLGILGFHYGTLFGASWRQADFTGDGAVDVGDLAILGANYGHTLAGLPA